MILAVYGKGGIGKSTITSNISALLGSRGKRVLQVGCDPKHDSTYILSGRFIKTVAEVLAERNFNTKGIKPEDVVFPGRFGTSLVEVGGPEAGKGCGGYVVGETIEILKQLGVFDRFDYIIFDVLGDVVCGGFAVPMNFADIVYVVSGNGFDSIFAANRINAAVVEKNRFYPVRLGGIIGNKCEGREFLDEFCRLSKSPLIICLPFLQGLYRGRQTGRTFLEMQEPDNSLSFFEEIVSHIERRPKGVVPETIPDQDVFRLFSGEKDAEREYKT